MENKNQTMMSANEDVKIVLPHEHGAVQFLKKQKLALFLGLVLLTMGFVFFTLKPNGVGLKTQLNNTVDIPTDTNTDLPVLPDNTNENQDHVAVEEPILLNINDNINPEAELPVLVFNANENTGNLSLLEENVNTYEPFHTTFLDNLEPANMNSPYLHSAAPVDTNAKSGPETILIICLSVGVTGMVLYVRKKQTS